MFRREDKQIVTQSEHSRLSGELALLFGKFLKQRVGQLAGAIALHDWPHFGGAAVDTIEIGKKTDDEQRELVERLAGDLPLDRYTELVVRLHWRRLTKESDVALRDAVNSDRIDALLSELRVSHESARRLDRWTDVCDSIAYYLSLGQSSSRRYVLLDVAGDKAEARSWEFQCRITAETLDVWHVRSAGPGEVTHHGERPELEPLRTEVSLLTYGAAQYPDSLVPSLRSIVCTFVVDKS